MYRCEKRKLTPKTLDAVKRAAGRPTYEIADTVTPGLRVRISETGRRTFILLARYPGQRSSARRKIGVYGAITLERARAKARDWQELIQKGIDPALQEEHNRQAEIIKQGMTFGAVADDFIREKLPTERKRHDVERELRRELFPDWEHLPISEIDDLRVITLVKRKGRKAPVGARNLLALIKRFFNWAIAQRIYGLKISPCSNLRAKDIVGEINSRDRILNDDELFALWRAVAHLPQPYGNVYRLLTRTALRLREVANASRNELDADLWTIPAARMKGKNAGKNQARDHVVPIVAGMSDELSGLPKHNADEYLFSTTAGESPVWIGAKVKRRIDLRMLRTLRALARMRNEDASKVVLQPWVNHDIRRTVRSHLSRLKISEEAREALLAHRRLGIKQTYDRYEYLDEKREALVLWAQRLKSIVAPRKRNVLTLELGSRRAAVV